MLGCFANLNWGGGVVSDYKSAAAFNTDTTPTQPHRNSDTHQTKNNTTNAVIQQKKSQAPDDGSINVRKC